MDLSLTQFNIQLERCIQEESLTSLTSYRVRQERKYSDFVSFVISKLKAFPDRTNHNEKAKLKSNVRLIHPLFTNYNDQIYQLFLGVMNKDEPAYVKKFDTFCLTAVKSLETEPAERLQMILDAPPVPKKNRKIAERLQFILSMLFLEACGLKFSTEEEAFYSFLEEQVKGTKEEEKKENPEVEEKLDSKEFAVRLYLENYFCKLIYLKDVAQVISRINRMQALLQNNYLRTDTSNLIHALINAEKYGVQVSYYNNHIYRRMMRFFQDYGKYKAQFLRKFGMEIGCFLIPFQENVYDSYKGLSDTTQKLRHSHSLYLIKRSNEKHLSPWKEQVSNLRAVLKERLSVFVPTYAGAKPTQDDINNFSYLYVTTRLSSLNYQRNYEKQNALYKLSYQKLSELAEKEDLNDFFKIKGTEEPLTESQRLPSELSRIPKFNPKVVLEEHLTTLFNDHSYSRKKQPVVEKRSPDNEFKEESAEEHREKELKPAKKAVKEEKPTPKKQQIEDQTPIDSLEVVTKLTRKRVLGKPFPFTYGERVRRWFGLTTEKPLGSKNFPEYQANSKEYNEQMVIFHGFSLQVDRFLTYGYEESWMNPNTKNKDRHFLIPAELCFQKNVYRGAIVYSVDQKGVCYHRYFEQKSMRELIKKFGTQTFLRTDFSELTDAAGQELPGKKIRSSSQDQVTLDQVFNIITIEDGRLNVVIKVFKVKDT